MTAPTDWKPSTRPITRLSFTALPSDHGPAVTAEKEQMGKMGQSLAYAGDCRGLRRSKRPARRRRYSTVDLDDVEWAEVEAGRRRENLSRAAFLATAAVDRARDARAPVSVDLSKLSVINVCLAELAKNHKAVSRLSYELGQLNLDRDRVLLLQFELKELMEELRRHVRAL